MLCLPFNERLRQLSAREFVEQVFVDGLGVKYLAFGDDFRFGNRREGDLDYVRALADEFGYAVAPTPTLEVAGERASSTRTRNALAARTSMRPSSYWVDPSSSRAGSYTVRNSAGSSMRQRRTLRFIASVHLCMGSMR